MGHAGRTYIGRKQSTPCPFSEWNILQALQGNSFRPELIRHTDHLRRSWNWASQTSNYPLPTRKAVIWWTSRVYLVQLNTHPRAPSPQQQPSVQYGTHYLPTRETFILPVVINVCFHCGGRVDLSDGDWKCVLLPPRMRNGGSGWVSMFVLAPAFSTYPALGILKKTCPVPSSVHCPIVFHFPHWRKWKRNRHKHPIVSDEICTGNWKFSQNRPGCVMARRWWAGRELQDPFRLQRCVLPFPWGAEATGLWVFSIMLM